MISSAKNRKIGLGLAILILAISLSACGGKPASNSSSVQPEKKSEASSANNQERSQVTDSGKDPSEVAGDQDRLEKEEQVLVYLGKAVPEVTDFSRNIEDYNQDSNTQCHLVMRIDSVPDPKAADVYKRDYYCIYVGSDMVTHTSRWNSFYVKEDLSEILVEDATGGHPLTVEQWRKINIGPGLPSGVHWENLE